MAGPPLEPLQASEEPMGNSKTFAVSRKHRRKRRSAKEKAAEFLRSKGGNASELSHLAQKILQRRLRLSPTSSS